MPPTPLSDPKIFPNENVLKGCLGAAMPAWQSFVGMLETDYPLVKPEWRYYNDGYQWLFKVIYKKKTLCWVKPFEKFFRMSFYYGGKADELIDGSSLDAKLKKQYHESEGKTFRPISMEIKKKSDLKEVRKLIELKMTTM